MAYFSGIYLMFGIGMQIHWKIIQELSNKVLIFLFFKYLLIYFLWCCLSDNLNPSWIMLPDCLQKGMKSAHMLQ